MITPTVTEMPRTLEPVCQDTFIARIGLSATTECADGCGDADVPRHLVTGADERP